MLSPDTEPEYVTPSTAPKVIAVPATCPLTCSVLGEVETAISPFRLALYWVQLSVKVPLKVPLY